jgi:hypothetical protein
MKGVMTLTPGTGRRNGMGLGSRREWDKWAEWRVTTECQTTCGGRDFLTNRLVPLVTLDPPAGDIHFRP